MSSTTAAELEQLAEGGAVRKKISETLTYRDMDGMIDNLWSVLYTTGYLTGYVDRDGMYILRIPNREVQEIFETDIIDWFNRTVRQDRESGECFHQL